MIDDLAVQMVYRKPIWTNVLTFHSMGGGVMPFLGSSNGPTKCVCTSLLCIVC